jgi:hypothetical protein
MIVTADSKSLFLQVSVQQLDDKTLLQVKQSFACRSGCIGSWVGARGFKLEKRQLAPHPRPSPR